MTAAALYVLLFWSYAQGTAGWMASGPPMAKDECIAQRERVHYRGTSLEAQSNDKHWNQHKPFCALYVG